LSPAALRTLSAQRVAGGTRFALPSAGDAFALITEDPQVIQSLRQRIARDGPRIVRLERDLIAWRSKWIADTARRLTQLGHSSDAAARGAASVDAMLRQIDAQLAAGRLEQAGELVQSASDVLDRAAAEQRRGVGEPAAFESHPLALSEEHLAEYAAFQRTYAGLRNGENLLYGGDFEDLGQMTQLGWRHFQHPVAGIHTHVELSASEPKHGGYCLALHSTTTAAGQQPVVEDAPVWVASPPVPLERGQIVEITGWVRIDQPLDGDGGGLQIVDSFGGPELTLTIRQTSGWQPFRMIRAATESAESRLIFALSGLGTARVDGVMVRALQQPVARRLPAATSPQSR
jgi:hypothetical protein